MSSREAKHDRERQRLHKSIIAEGQRRKTIHFDQRPNVNVPANADEEVLEQLEEANPESLRDDYDVLASTSPGIHSPSHHGPAIDFDGLSWPSESPHAALSRLYFGLN